MGLFKCSHPVSLSNWLESSVARSESLKNECGTLPLSLFRTLSLGKALQKSEIYLINIASGCGMQNVMQKAFENSCDGSVGQAVTNWIISLAKNDASNKLENSYVNLRWRISANTKLQSRRVYVCCNLIPNDSDKWTSSFFMFTALCHGVQ